MPKTLKHHRQRPRKYKLPKFSYCITCLSSTVFLFSASCLWVHVTHTHDPILVLRNDNDVPHSIIDSSKSFMRSAKIDSSSPKFVTIVLPSVVNTQQRTERLDSISETWGPSAHAIYVTHSQEEYDNNNNNINNNKHSNDSNKHSNDSNKFPQTLVVPSHVATVEDGVPRLQYVMKEIKTIYDPEFVFFVNDHTFVIPPHICSFLENRSPNEHLYAGHALTPRGDDGGITFNSGASGYFLSKKTLSSLVETWDMDGNNEVLSKHCSGSSKWLQGNPGLVTAECLAEYLNVLPLDTRDEEGRHLFHAFGLVRTVSGNVDNWYLNKHEALDKIFGEDVTYHHKPRTGKHCCGDKTISFHYVEFEVTRALYKILAKTSATKMDDKELQAFMMEQWPKDRKAIGGYAHPLPRIDDTKAWDELIHVIRLIAPSNLNASC